MLVGGGEVKVRLPSAAVVSVVVSVNVRLRVEGGGAASTRAELMAD